MATEEDIEITTAEYNFPEEEVCIDDELELLLLNLGRMEVLVFISDNTLHVMTHVRSV